VTLSTDSDLSEGNDAIMWILVYVIIIKIIKVKW